jgi:hypothetical protein
MKQLISPFFTITKHALSIAMRALGADSHHHDSRVNVPVEHMFFLILNL